MSDSLRRAFVGVVPPPGVIDTIEALVPRERTGRGQEIRSALFESTAFLVAQHMGQHALTGKAPAPMPEKASSWAVYDPFRTADGRGSDRPALVRSRFRSGSTGIRGPAAPRAQ